MTDTDELSRGFTSSVVDPLRYGRYPDDPREASGLVQLLIPEKSRVLDVGCGTGRLTVFIRENRGCDVVGIEPHPQRAEEARKQGVQTITGILDESVAASVGKFDVVVFADVLEHLGDPSKELILCRQVLKDDGSVVISVPNVAHWLVRINLLRGRFDYQPYGIMDATHLRWFTFDTLESLLKSTGFNVVDRRVSAGLWMTEYGSRRPWKWLKPSWRERLVLWGVRSFPRFFGCQLVFRAMIDPAFTTTAQ